jgi:Zn-dependent metalloprotease
VILHSDHSRHTPLYCIVPPAVLRRLAEDPDPAVRSAALAALSLDSTTRLVRASAQLRRIQNPPRLIPQVGPPRKNVRIFDAQNTWNLPGALRRSEGDAVSGGDAVNEAFDGLTATWQLYAQQYGRNSIDDNGMDLIGSVHVGANWGNAQWDGTQMRFGDGLPNVMNRLTSFVDILGHELTHGVTERTAGLIYSDQPGALNESISDVFGSLVKQFVDNEDVNAADWLIGEGIWALGINGRALRDMANPGTAYDDPRIGTDDQPADMNHYVPGGDVHTNSGIPNHAFYLLAMKLGGRAWERAGRIWYETLRDPRLRNDAQFVDFARLTVDDAGRLYGHDSYERRAVAEAWSEVGVQMNGVWGHFDLSDVTGAPPAAGDPNGYVFDAENRQHIVYRGNDGHIHELAYTKP